MTVIFGYDESKERIKNDTMNPSKRVAIDHDFYSNNHEAAARKNKEVQNAIDDDLGYAGGYRYDSAKKKGNKAKAENFAVRSKHAIGGTAKVRLYEKDRK